MNLDMSTPCSRPLVAVITGSSSGIGSAAAQFFARRGYQLSLNGRNENALKETVERCVNKGLPKESILTTTGDLTNEKITTALIDNTIQKFGQIDTLINAAGILVSGNVAEASLKDYDDVMNVNVRSVVQLTQKAIPHLIKTKGSIVNVSSINGPCPFAGVTFYCMSKSALDQFTKCLAVELGPYGVRVNSVNPGFIITDIHKRSGMDDQKYKEFLEKCASFAPLKRVGSVEEVAKAIYFLASEEQSFITGDLLRVDGGRGIVHLR